MTRRSFPIAAALVPGGMMLPGALRRAPARALAPALAAALPGALAAVLAAVLLAASAAAQNPPAGVELSTPYDVSTRPILSVRPLEAGLALAPEAGEIAAILSQDLRFSNRFAILEAPERLATGAVEYEPWNVLRVMYLVEGALRPSPGGYRLDLTLHDVPFENIKARRSYELPPRSDPGFRMAVHAVSDDIVLALTGEKGMAATRIAFVRKNAAGSYDLLIIDSDGENLRRLFGEGGIVYGPTFSPDGRKLAYVASPDMSQWELVERDLQSGATRVLDRGASLFAPDYSPDGRRMSYAIFDERGSRLVERELSSGQTRVLYNGRGNENVTAAMYSPDGRRFAVVSSRLGNPHVFLMDANGGGFERVSPYVQGQRAQFAAPSWSPKGELAFTGGFLGSEQVVVRDPARISGQARQLTQRGTNEDPAWAPDGRHIVYSGSAGGGSVLYIIDTVTLESRELVGGGELRLPAWSPSLSRLGPPPGGTR